MNYTENDLVKIAKRENNTKRGYLVVDPLQGKHIPVVPSQAIQLFQKLAENIRDKYPGEELLVVGFAETATAIGARVAVELKAKYIQTTREEIQGVSYLFFSEVHSHATQQKLVKEDMDQVMGNIHRIIFVEDEVTTGNTIRNIVELLKTTYTGSMKFTIASLLNGMDENDFRRWEEEQVDLFYVVKTCHANYEDKALKYKEDGYYFPVNPQENTNYNLTKFGGYLNPRRLVEGERYQEACRLLADEIFHRQKISSREKVLVLGTEECMYPALCVGEKLELAGCQVRCHATTRSPIAVSREEGYPLQERYELESVYDRKRRTFLYDIGEYDKVIIVTDTQAKEEALYSLVNALQRKNENVEVVRWS